MKKAVQRFAPFWPLLPLPIFVLSAVAVSMKEWSAAAAYDDTEEKV
jgi:hypothetical protein